MTVNPFFCGGLFYCQLCFDNLRQFGIHIYPKDDVQKHTGRFDCWCSPAICNQEDLDKGEAKEEVWLHNRIKDNLQ